MSLRTTNGMRLLPPVSLRTRCARYRPDTAVLGTAQEADTAQLPQSMSPVGPVSFLHAGWDCGSEAVGSMLETTLRAPLPWYQPIRRMSMWYELAGVLILKFSVCPAFTLIDVAKPWIVESPAPLTCQSLGGSPGCVFSQAITLVPHGVEVGVGVTLGVGVAVGLAVGLGLGVTLGVSVAVAVGIGVGPVPVWKITSTQ